ncbi:MAG: cbb3-type cytochrome c oxidase subunit I [Verrucomicrobiales bacterium]|nr:cbb3-type cytochrome c oxidase subunit I [Verrucomicrobiales bacterium]
MNEKQIDTSCRVPLLVLFGGAALWLVVGSVLALVASLTFHMPDKFGDCPWGTYGHLQPAADDALLYGFCIPAGLGVLLWIFARIGQTPLRGAMVPVVAAHLWHLGVLAGLVGIFVGDSTGFAWLEFPRGGSALLFFAYLLLGLWALMNFSGRNERGMFPSHWFLIAALFVFPWIYSTANILLVGWPVRGVVQAIIAWWFGNNLVFLWTSLVGIGAAFYFLPKFSGRPLHSYYYALFAFWTLLLFGSMRGVPVGAPVPAWLPALSAMNSLFLIVPVIAIAIIGWKTVRGGAGRECKGGSFCMIKFSFVAFILSALLLVTSACPHFSRLTQFTWFGAAQTQLQLYGFFAITMFGAIYHILPRAVGIEFAFPKLIRVQHWFAMAGIILFVVSLVIGGVVQGLKLQDPNVAFADSTKAMLPFLRASTMGLLFMLVANLLFTLNVIALIFAWKWSVAKTVFAFLISPLAKTEVKA